MTTTESPAGLIEELFCKGHPLDAVVGVGQNVGWTRDDVLAVLRNRQWDLDGSGRLPRSKRITAPQGLRAARPSPPAAPPPAVRRTRPTPEPHTPAVVDAPSIDNPSPVDPPAPTATSRPPAAVFSVIADWADDDAPVALPPAAPPAPVEPTRPSPRQEQPRRATPPAPDTDAAVARFLDERTVPAADEQFLTSPDLRAAYEAWRGPADAPAVTTRQFGTALTSRYRKKQSPTVINGAKPMCYHGLAWKQAETPTGLDQPVVDGPPTPEQIRARVDEMAPRTKPDGSINSQHVAMEQTLRSRHGHPSYIANLDGPGKFRPVPASMTPTEGTAPAAPATGAAGMAPDLSGSGHGYAGPDAQPQVSPSRSHSSRKGGGLGASDVPAEPPVAPRAAGVQLDLLAAGRKHPDRRVRAAARAVELAVDALCAALKRVS